MATALIPVLRAGGTAAIQALPGVIDAVKKNAPAAYEKVSDLVGKGSGGKTAEQVAVAVVGRKDKFGAQALLEVMMRSGVDPAVITAAAPMISREELASLVVHFRDIDKIERAAASASVPVIEGAPDEVFAHDNMHIVRVCRSLGISSDQLLDLLVLIKTRGPEQIKRYQTFEFASGRKPL